MTRDNKSTGPAVATTTSPKRVLVSDFLPEKAIAFFPAGPSKQQVLGNLIGSLDLPDPGGALRSILAREEAGSTVIAPGLALPHARIMGISTIKAALGICPTGIHYSHAAGGPVHLMMLFLGPAENMREHLAFLASVSALFQLEGVMDEILGLATSDPLRQAALKTDDKGGMFGESMERLLLRRGDLAVRRSIRSLGLREKTGASLVAVYRRGKLKTDPPAEMTLLPNDILVLMGSSQERVLARKLLTR